MRMLRRAALLLAVGLSLSLACAGSALASFGFQAFDNTVLNQDGSPDAQAGSHPWAMTTGFTLNKTTNLSGQAIPDGDLKDIRVELPPGLVGDPTATLKCTRKQFETPDPNNLLSGASCPADTQIGIAAVELLNAGAGVGNHDYFGVYNLVPPPGLPAEFGFNPIGIPIVLKPTVRTGGDYGLTVDVDNASQEQGIGGSIVTLWGVPADPGHDPLRGKCLPTSGVSEGLCPTELPLKSFLTLPTSCPAGPLTLAIQADSWEEPGVFVGAEAFNHDGAGNPVGVVGCDRLPFGPTLAVTPESAAASSPTGLDAKLRIPQNDAPEGLAEAHLKKAVVRLPVGMSVSPSAANGLEACTPEEIELKSAAATRCPPASKIGTAVVHSPLLEEPLTGSVYLAQQGNNPFGSLLALYLVAEGDGVLVKLAGEVHLDPSSGQVTTTFDNNPQLPFEELELTFFGGSRAALSTPAACGRFETESSLTPYSTELPVVSRSPFEITANCASGFSPSFSAGATGSQAAGFNPFTLTLSRGDRDQQFEGIAVRMPPGLLGMLSRVSLCEEPQAALGACPASSRIGHVTAGAGPGTDPVWVPGEVFLTGPHAGAPFGLSVVVPVKAGPFDLGSEVVRAAIEVDPHTSQLTVRSDALPVIRDGVPLQIRTINVAVDREGFMFNPTNCSLLSIGGTITSQQGATANVSSPFQATNCATLGFKPKFTASTQGSSSHAKGASLDVKIGYPKGAQANIRSVRVVLPKQLPSRLTTLQKACTEATFDANPATCPPESDIGTAKATTPVLNVPLTGPAYLVSHGGAAFPDLIVILQGQGITVDLDGATNIAKGITSSTFAAVPDVPVSSFELKLPKGPHSALTENLPKKTRGSFCTTKLVMPTTITGQNGARIKQNTRIAVTGCAKKRPPKKRKKG
jgi:hypothetical protein